MDDPLSFLDEPGARPTRIKPPIVARSWIPRFLVMWSLGMFLVVGLIVFVAVIPALRNLAFLAVFIVVIWRFVVVVRKF